jgi:hypothetical protein
MRKMRVVNKTAIAVAVSTVFFLSACAGGGGGSGANNPGSSAPPTQGTGPSVPSPSPTPNPTPDPLPAYGTPVKIATFDPLVNVAGTGYKYPIVDTFTADITGNGQDVIVAGRMTQSTTVPEWGNNRITMMSWENGTMVDKTAQWFPGGINEILGTEPSVKFADFFKSGKTDMFVAPSTDMRHHAPATVFINQGNKFSRLDIPLSNVWAHDSAIADLDGDTYKDIIVTDYGSNTTMLINNTINNFTPMIDTRGAGNELRWGGSAIAVADFLQNGKNQLIITDNTCNTTSAGCVNANSTKMYTWTIDKTTNTVNYTWHSDLPTPRFSLPKWSSYGFAGSHAVRAAAFDFNDDRIPDTIVFSMPVAGPTTPSNKYSEIQFLANNGTGRFTDVTDTTLVGYNHNTYTTYNPKFVDLNGDGRIDIMVSGHDYTGKNDSHQFLLKSSDGKYVAAHQNILTNFATDVNRLQNTDNGGNTVNLVKGPDGKLFLVSAVSFMNGTDRQIAFYMSPLGTQSTTTVQTATQLIKTVWPYMTERQVAQTLATTSTSFTTSAGTGYLIDLDTIMKPWGSVGFQSAGGIKPISGFLTGVDIGDGKAVAMDQLGRSFNLNIKGMTAASAPNAFMMNMNHNDEHNLSSHAEYLVGGPVYNINGIRVGADTRFNNNDGTSALMSGRSGGQLPQQYTIGMPSLYRKGQFNFGMQYTSLANNPFLFMSGAWGQVNNSVVLDHVLTYQSGGFSVQKGIMYTTTNITPGLVTNITPITSAWAESGYRFTQQGFGDLGFYAGVKPIVLSGSVEANIPTAVDNAGNTVYTKQNMQLQNTVTGYARMLYTNKINQDTLYRFSAIATQQGQYRIMNEIRWVIK